MYFQEKTDADLLRVFWALLIGQWRHSDFLKKPPASLSGAAFMVRQEKWDIRGHLTSYDQNDHTVSVTKKLAQYFNIKFIVDIYQYNYNTNRDIIWNYVQILQP